MLSGVLFQQVCCVVRCVDPTDVLCCDVRCVDLTGVLCCQVCLT